MRPASPGPDPVGVALAGGASTRMGRDKASLVVDGRTLLESAVERLREVCPEVVAADRGRGLLEGVTSIEDGPGRGPAAGILGAAAARPGRSLLVLACDLPEVPVALLFALAAEPAGDWVVPDLSPAGGLEPLAALYRPPALDALARQVAAGRYAVHLLAEVPGLDVRRLTAGELAVFGPPERLFANLNTPADVAARALRRAEPEG